MMNIEEFEPVFRHFVTAFNKDNTPERVTVYFTHLQYFDACEVAEVLREAIEGDEFFPTVPLLVSRLKSRRKIKTIECEYCSGSGFEFVYSAFEIVGNTHKCGPPVTKQQYEADPVTYRMFARRCRCRPLL